MAPPHCDGRVLPKRPASDVDRMVCATSAALVPSRDGSVYVGSGARSDLDGGSAANVSNRFVLATHATTSRNHSDKQLLFPELPCPRIGNPLTRRQAPGAFSTTTPTQAGDARRSRCGAYTCRKNEQNCQKSLGINPKCNVATWFLGRSVFPGLGFLRYCGAAPMDASSTSPLADVTSHWTRAFSDCESIWPICRDDQRALRNRVSRLKGRQDLDALSLSI